MAESEHKSSTKKNFMYQMVYELLILLLPLIVSPYISRVVGAEGLGIFSYSYSIASYFVLFSMLGLKNYGCRVIAQSREDNRALSELFWNLFALHAIISLVTCLLYLGYTLFSPDDSTYAFIQFFYVVSGVFDISWFYFGIEKFKLTVVRNIVIRLLTVVSIFLLVRRSSDLWKYCLIMALSQLFGQVALWLPLRRYVRYIRPRFREMVPHIRPLMILFIPVVAISLYKYMDKIMIGAMSNKIQLGYYENAEKITAIATTIISAFGMVMLPKMSNFVANGGTRQIGNYITASMKYIMCIAFSLTFGMAAVGRTFAPMFWGREFMASGDLIIGLAVTIPFIAFANVIRTQYLIPKARDKEYTLSVIAGAAVNLVLNALLIPKMGAMGATIGTIAAEVMVCLTQAYSVRETLQLGLYVKNALPFLGFGVLMFALVSITGTLIQKQMVRLLSQVGMGILVYCTCCALFFWKTRDRFFLDLLKRISHLGSGR